jgi:SPX domain protein involved in polyphosphate accumulation
MLLTPLEFRQGASAVIVLGRDGGACVFKPVRGSERLSFSDVAQFVEAGRWKGETVPTHIRGVYESLSDAYEKYLYYRGLNCDLTAERWLNTADAFAARISSFETIHREIPKVITIFVERKTSEKEKTIKCVSCSKQMRLCFEKALIGDMSAIEKNDFPTMQA